MASNHSDFVKWDGEYFVRDLDASDLPFIVRVEVGIEGEDETVTINNGEKFLLYKSTVFKRIHGLFNGKQCLIPYDKFRHCKCSIIRDVKTYKSVGELAKVFPKYAVLKNEFIDYNEGTVIELKERCINAIGIDAIHCLIYGTEEEINIPVTFDGKFKDVEEMWQSGEEVLENAEFPFKLKIMGEKEEYKEILIRDIVNSEPYFIGYAIGSLQPFFLILPSALDNEYSPLFSIGTKINDDPISSNFYDDVMKNLQILDDLTINEPDPSFGPSYHCVEDVCGVFHQIPIVFEDKDTEWEIRMSSYQNNQIKNPVKEKNLEKWIFFEPDLLHTKLSDKKRAMSKKKKQRQEKSSAEEKDGNNDNGKRRSSIVDGIKNIFGGLRRNSTTDNDEMRKMEAAQQKRKMSLGANLQNRRNKSSPEVSAYINVETGFNKDDDVFLENGKTDVERFGEDQEDIPPPLPKKNELEKKIYDSHKEVFQELQLKSTTGSPPPLPERGNKKDNCEENVKKEESTNDSPPKLPEKSKKENKCEENDEIEENPYDDPRELIKDCKKEDSQYDDPRELLADGCNENDKSHYAIPREIMAYKFEESSKIEESLYGDPPEQGKNSTPPEKKAQRPEIKNKPRVLPKKLSPNKPKTRQEEIEQLSKTADNDPKSDVELRKMIDRYRDSGLPASTEIHDELLEQY